MSGISEKKIYNYTIPEFKDNIRFALADQTVGVMFVFTDIISKCIISKNSLILDDKSAEFECYSAEILDSESLIAAFVNESNDIVILDYQLQVVRRVEGVRGASFLQSMSWMSITWPDIYTKKGEDLSGKTPPNDARSVLWLKGNHQACIIDATTGEETARAPLFGTVNSYSEHVPLLAAHSAGTFVGFGFEKNDFWLSWAREGSQKITFPIQQAIPEARNLLSLHLTQSGGTAVCLLSSSRELSQSTVILGAFSVGDSLRLFDYRRVGAFSPDFLPRLDKSPDGKLFVLNLGQRVEVFTFSEQANKLDKVYEVEDLAAEPISWVTITTPKREFKGVSPLSVIAVGSNPSQHKIVSYSMYLFPRSSTGFCRIDISLFAAI